MNLTPNSADLQSALPATKIKPKNPSPQAGVSHSQFNIIFNYSQLFPQFIVIFKINFIFENNNSKTQILCLVPQK